MTGIAQKVQSKTGMELSVIHNIIELLDQGNTIPFIARYRKEMTKGATDEQLRDFHDIYTYTKNLESRKEDVIRLIDEKWLMTPELKQQILEAITLARVEDLYRPFKEKKNTKASLAKAKGLEPLADILKKANLSKEEFDIKAAEFIKEDKDPKKTVKDVVEAVQWAKDIIAEEVSDHADLREDIKKHEEINALMKTKPGKKYEEWGVYKIYKSYSKKISEMPSYAYLAVIRAEKEKQLSLKLNLDEEKHSTSAQKLFIPKNANTSSIYIEEAIADGLKRLLLPSLDREIKSNKKQRADEAAIKVFGDNLKHMLLTPPVKWFTVLWFDPAFRTWCKLAVVDKTGKFLYNSVIYPTAPQNKVEAAEAELLKIISKFNIELIVIWNGTASRESEKIVAAFIKKHKLDVQYMIVSEAGASVYSASKLAQDEYPTLDVTVRWAISIAHRVQDPMAELTKIDPKSIWIGQYQHDVDQKLLKQKLEEKVEDTVNSVGVDLNTASYPLLQNIAWLSTTIAKNIVAYRDENGEFDKKAQLKKTKWLWPKAYEQCVWFLRIKWGKDVLDATGIHPEIHKQVYKLIEDELNIKKAKLKLPLSADLISKLSITDIVERYEIGFETMQDVLAELQRPGLDPRENIDAPSFKSDVMEVEDLKEWFILDGVIRNVTDFGAFVDIWLHNDGLVHKSQMAPFFVKNSIDVVSVGQNVKVKVLEIDQEREKVSLSMKDCDNEHIRAGKKPKFSDRPRQDRSIRRETQRLERFTDTPDIKLSGNITFS